MGLRYKYFFTTLNADVLAHRPIWPPAYLSALFQKTLEKGIWRGRGVRSLENAPILERLIDSSARIAIDII
jgi:hypothetical protein